MTFLCFEIPHRDLRKKGFVELPFRSFEFSYSRFRQGPPYSDTVERSLNTGISSEEWVCHVELQFLPRIHFVCFEVFPWLCSDARAGNFYCASKRMSMKQEVPTNRKSLDGLRGSLTGLSCLVVVVWGEQEWQLFSLISIDVLTRIPFLLVGDCS